MTPKRFLALLLCAAPLHLLAAAGDLDPTFAGVGKVVLRLPEGVGVRITGREDGVGSFAADGFIAQGDSWVNEAYSAASGPKIELDLTRGVGDVTLVLVP